MTGSDDVLETLRRRIDALDDRLLDLLEERIDVVLEIAAAKGLDQPDSAAGFAMRPAREVAILRRLLGRRRGPLPAAVVMRLWRELFAVTTRLQSPMEVCLCDESRAFWDLARFYYGSNVPIRALASAEEVVRRVQGAAAYVGLVPAPQKGDNAGWWHHLAGGPANIVAKLPLLADAPATHPQALVLARLAPEPSGDDTTVLAAALSTPASASGLATLMASLGLPGAAVVSSGERDVLFDVPGFIAADDPRLTQLRPPLEAVHVVGAYPNPIAAAAEPAGTPP